MIVGAVLYFGLVKPYEAMQARAKATEGAPGEATETSPTEELLVEIRDLLKGK